MAFNTAITGLKASTIELDVTGNNIANASTVGFKSGRTEFADIFTTVVVGAGSTNNPGAGVIVSDIAQDFTAGTIEFTNNNLDLAIDGTGFFQLSDGQGGTTYTRAGGFELDKDGNVVSKNGKFLQGYGLDDAGNQLPIGNLAVSQKESAPQATNNIDLSFNVDSRADADGLLRPYDPDDSASFTFSTTTRTFDSLGNENTIKFDFVEQPSVRERQTVNLTPDTFAATAGTSVTIAGATLAVTDGITTEAALATDIAVTNKAANLTALRNSDPRIADISVNATTNLLEITYFASAANVEDVVTSFPMATAVDVTSAEISAAEVQRLEFDNDPVGTTTGSITIGSGTNTFTVSYDAGAGDTRTDIINRFVQNQSAILAAIPEIDSVSPDPTDPNVLVINYKNDLGNLNPLPVSETVTGVGAVSALNQVLHGTDITGGVGAALTTENGDNSFQGVYQMYAYLNGTDLLDIGKALPPGASGNPTEPGPVVITFDNTTGTLQTVNGQPVSASGLAPRLTVENADPANPQTDILLDLSGTTQFASESIVKAATQDGFTKGDLIGVTFAEDGTMVASFSNGQNTNLGIVALATFENQGGLQPTGNTEWSATLESGQAILNPPGTGLNGSLRSAALEQSNVDLSEELVALIEAQRNFQANSKTLQTENAVTQAILQIS